MLKYVLNPTQEPINVWSVEDYSMFNHYMQNALYWERRGYWQQARAEINSAWFQLPHLSGSRVWAWVGKHFELPFGKG